MALFRNPTARNAPKRWAPDAIARQWNRACKEALGCCCDRRSPDHYSKPEITREAIVAARPARHLAGESHESKRYPAESGYDSRMRNAVVAITIGLFACSEDPYERLAQCTMLVEKGNECLHFETEEEAKLRCAADPPGDMRGKTGRILQMLCEDPRCGHQSRDDWDEGKQLEFGVCREYIKGWHRDRNR